MLAAVVGCLAGAALLLIAGGRTWASVSRPAPFHGVVAVSGHQLTAATTAIGLLGLAAVAGVVATRSWGRLAAGAVLLAAGVAAAVACATVVGAQAARAAADLPGSHAAVTTSGWQWGAVAGGVLLALAGAMTAVRGRRWPSMGARYEAGAARSTPARDPEAVAWEALDRGEDPTD